jgi:uncharacterized membrane protein YccC
MLPRQPSQIWNAAHDGLLKTHVRRALGPKDAIALAIRIAVAAVAAYVIAVALHLMLPLWAVLTSPIVTQMSAGRSLKANWRHMLGTIGGAILAAPSRC